MAQAIPQDASTATGDLDFTQNLAVDLSVLALVNTHIAEIPAAFKSGVHREYALVGTVHCCPNVHIARQLELLSRQAQPCTLFNKALNAFLSYRGVVVCVRTDKILFQIRPHL